MRSLLPPVHQARRSWFDRPARAAANQHTGPFLPHYKVSGGGAGEGPAPDPAGPQDPLELVRFEPAGSRTEAGVMRPSSRLGSDKGKNLHSRGYLESPPSVLMR
ncbi:hypothetical protein NL676_009532 [Syzygium grande]|nr:hypothetical protein NL676_009532 [Syzygium grande]